MLHADLCDLLNCVACSYKYGGPEGVQIVSYSTPATPGNCRVLFCVVMDRRTAPKKTIQFLDLRPVWLKFVDHYERNEVLDGDNCFLHMQVNACLWWICCEACVTVQAMPTFRACLSHCYHNTFSGQY